MRSISVCLQNDRFPARANGIALVPGDLPDSEISRDYSGNAAEPVIVKVCSTPFAAGTGAAPLHMNPIPAQRGLRDVVHRPLTQIARTQIEVHNRAGMGGIERDESLQDLRSGLPPCCGGTR